jgi:hypothetical protein
VEAEADLLNRGTLGEAGERLERGEGRPIGLLGEEDVSRAFAEGGEQSRGFFGGVRDANDDQGRIKVFAGGCVFKGRDILEGKGFFYTGLLKALLFVLVESNGEDRKGRRKHEVFSPDRGIGEATANAKAAWLWVV